MDRETREKVLWYLENAEPPQEKDPTQERAEIESLAKISGKSIAEVEKAVSAIQREEAEKGCLSLIKEIVIFCTAFIALLGSLIILGLTVFSVIPFHPLAYLGNGGVYFLSLYTLENLFNSEKEG